MAAPYTIGPFYPVIPLDEFAGLTCAQASLTAKKSNLFCHSERSEESLLGLNPKRERFLGAQRASE
jgi:hypothetical protein